MDNKQSSANACPYCGATLYGLVTRCYKCGKIISKSKLMRYLDEKLEKVDEKQKKTEIPSVKVPYSKEVSFPNVCPCCLNECKPGEEMAVETLVPQVHKEKAKVFLVPTCSYCENHWQKTNRYNRIVMWLYGIFIFLSIGFIYQFVKIVENMPLLKAILSSGLAVGLLLGIFLLITFPFRPKKIDEAGHLDRRVEPVQAQYEVEGNKNEYVGFAFGNQKYAEKFRDLNHI